MKIKFIQVFLTLFISSGILLFLFPQFFTSSVSYIKGHKIITEKKKRQDADPSTAVIPALHYIEVVAQGSRGADGKYRTRMPRTEKDKVLAIAEKINALVFLDIQVGFSNVQTEVPLLLKYLKMPQVHLGIDPECTC